MLIDATRVFAMIGVLMLFQHVVQSKQKYAMTCLFFAFIMLLINDLIILHALFMTIFIFCSACLAWFLYIRKVWQETTISQVDNEPNNIAPLPVIMNGEIQYSQLEQLNQNEFWLRKKIRELGYRDIKSISYCSVQGDQLYYIDISDKK